MMPTIASTNRMAQNVFQTITKILANDGTGSSDMTAPFMRTN